MSEREQMIRDIRNYCNEQGIFGCFNYDGTCKLCYYCEKLYNCPVCLWFNDYFSDIDIEILKELYEQIKEN